MALLLVLWFLIRLLIVVSLFSVEPVIADNVSCDAAAAAAAAGAQQKKPFDYVLVTDDLHLTEKIAVWDDGILEEKMKAQGLRVVRKSFSDPDFDWSRTKWVILRSCWGRDKMYDKWLKFLDDIKNKTTLVNYELLEGTTNKTKYFERLVKDHGINIPSTVFVKQGSSQDTVGSRTLRQIQKEHGWETMVIKPNSGQGGNGNFKVTLENMDEMESKFQNMLQDGDMLVQEFQRHLVVDEENQKELHEFGEISIIAINRKITHAIRKLPLPGKYIVQSGYSWPHKPTKKELVFAKRVIRAFDDVPVLSYLRIDIFRDNSNKLALMEVAGRSTDLFFRTVPSAAEALAKHLSDLVREQPCSSSEDDSCEA